MKMMPYDDTADLRVAKHLKENDNADTRVASRVERNVMMSGWIYIPYRNRTKRELRRR